MAFKSYTMGSPEMIAAMDAAFDAMPSTFVMKLNAADMKVLVRSLVGQTYLTEPLSEEEEDRATSLFSSIASTFEIEGV